MEFFSETKKELENNKFKHLKEGIIPIRVCLEETLGSKHSEIEKFGPNNGKMLHNINWYSSVEDLERLNFLNSGKGTYIISVVDNLDKFTMHLACCTSLIVCGVDKETGENISFLTHQYPGKFLSSKKDVFIKHLDQRLSEIQQRCQEGTVDALIVGGMGVTSKEIKEYDDSVRLLSGEVEQKFSFKPYIVNGPKKGYIGFDSVYYEISKRRAFLFRPDLNEKWIN